MSRPGTSQALDLTINQKENPAAWPLFLMDLDEVREHLDSLIQKMQTAGAIDEDEFAVDMGHIYAHLNRIWHSRNRPEDIPEELWEQFSQFPQDLKPIG